ncbi:MAG: exodeoxyribonuclease VII small subunit [Candidatus Eremiobacteraeota bacterium]|nr:exodeoxyribonuclease VII small subunit [Candidatus Eremiobacteraeota bacterium]
MKKDLSRIPYDRLYEQLEEIVEKMEKGDLELEQALLQYEQGVTLYRECEKRLKEAESRLLVLKGEKEGVAALEPFSLDEEEERDDE